MRTYEIDSFTYERRRGAMQRVARAIADAGACVVDHRIISADRIELVVELRSRAGLELYCALAGQGVELSRYAQQTLITLWDRRRYPDDIFEPWGESISIRLVVRFMEDAPLSTLLTRSSLVV